MDENSNGAGPVRVSFGQREDQDMPLSWAESMLAALKNEHPNVFGKLLQRAAGVGK